MGFGSWQRIPGWCWAIALLLSAATLPSVVDFGAGRFRVRYDPSTNLLFPHDDEAGDFYRCTRRIFGNDETVIVASARGRRVPRRAARVAARLSQRLAALPGVHHVSSLATVPVPRAGARQTSSASSRCSRACRPTTARARRCAREALANPLLVGRVVSRDGRMLARSWCTFVDFSDREFFLRELDREISRMAREEARGVEVHSAARRR